MDRFEIMFDKPILPETSEYLEDVIAVVLECLGINGAVLSHVTGNLTRSPFTHEIKGDALVGLHKLSTTLLSKLADPTVYCPECGSDEIATCEDDDLMRECGNCGYSWEVEDEQWTR